MSPDGTPRTPRLGRVTVSHTTSAPQAAHQGITAGHAQRGPLRVLTAAGRANVMRRLGRRLFARVEYLLKPRSPLKRLEPAAPAPATRLHVLSSLCVRS